jgi:ABC-type transport system substrate-binding protein
MWTSTLRNWRGASSDGWETAVKQLKWWLAAVALSVASVHAAEPKKILRVAYQIAESNFDPAAVNDLYSRTLNGHMFEALYTYDHLARPAKIIPLIAADMPAVSPDFRVWTIKLRQGIYFQDDPVFKGQKREVTAQDFVYPFQRMADPANKSPLWGWMEGNGIVGLLASRKAAIDGKKPYDYNAPIEGLRALDRYTIQFTLDKPRPHFLATIATNDLTGAQAREVVAHYGDKIGAHPVGTGPFRLKQWRRSSLIVLERNPDYRDVRYDAQPAADDAAGQAILAQLKGRKIPMVDEVHVSIIEEEQPRWLSFLNAEIDTLAGQTGAVPGSFVVQAMPGGKLSPTLAKKNVQAYQQVNSDSTLVYFNMEDPVVGGMAPHQVALRRAISLALDVDQLVRIGYKNQAIPAQSPIHPHTTGYSKAFKSEMSEYSPAKAKALLELFGYKDRDGDGWRDLPDGKPLVIERASQPDQLARELETLWSKDLRAVGIRTRSPIAKWPEQIKQARAGKLQVWALGYSSAGADGHSAFQKVDSRQAGGGNLSRFKLPRMDELYDAIGALPDGDEREALFQEAKLISIAYMPYRILVHRISTDLAHPWVIGFRRPQFWSEWYHMVDIDLSKKPAK